MCAVTRSRVVRVKYPCCSPRSHAEYDGRLGVSYDRYNSRSIPLKDQELNILTDTDEDGTKFTCSTCKIMQPALAFSRKKDNNYEKTCQACKSRKSTRRKEVKENDTSRLSCEDLEKTLKTVFDAEEPNAVKCRVLLLPGMISHVQNLKLEDAWNHYMQALVDLIEKTTGYRFM